MQKLKYYLLLALFVTCASTSPYIASSQVSFDVISDIDLNTAPPPDITLNDLNQAWHGIYLNQAYIKPFLGGCDAKHVNNCVEYAYLATYKALGGKISYRTTLAITYWGELAIFGHSNNKLKVTSYEALFRNFFDSQGGGCRFNHNDIHPYFDCRYSNMIDWLSTSQHWRDVAVPSSDGLYIRVNLGRLLGIPVKDLGTKTLRGFMGFDTDPFDHMIENITLWRNGQGSDVPSTWGNTRIEAGSTSFVYAKPSEDKGHIIVHYYANRKPTIGTDMPEVPSCTLVSMITTVDGRMAGLSTCK